MRRVFPLLSTCLVMSLVLAPSAIAQSVENDPTSYDISEFNPDGPCFDPENASSVSGVPVEDLPNAFLNRNDPPGRPICSPLDPDDDGIVCNNLTQEEAKELGRDAYILSESEDGNTSATDGTSSATTEEYAEDTETINTLPDTSGPPLGAIGAGLGLLLAAGGLLLKRHLT